MPVTAGGDEVTGDQRWDGDLPRIQGVCPGAGAVRVDMVMLLMALPLALLACAFVHGCRVDSVLRVSPLSSRRSASFQW